jgi:hypothetical protein
MGWHLAGVLLFLMRTERETTTMRLEWKTIGMLGMAGMAGSLFQQGFLYIAIPLWIGAVALALPNQTGS